MCSAHNIGGSKGQFVHMEQGDERDVGRVLRFSALDGFDFWKKQQQQQQKKRWGENRAGGIWHEGTLVIPRCLQVRVYDPASPQRRPVLEVTYGEYPLMAMTLTPGGK